jgi:DNA-binding beta-propeller fold protein YncE
VNNKYIYITDVDNGGIHVLDASNGSYIQRVTYEVRGYPHDVTDICVSPDGNFLIAIINSQIVKYMTPGSTMGGRRHKKGMRRKHRKSRARRLNKKGTKRKQRK